MIVFPDNGAKVGELVQVRVTECTPATLIGEAIKNLIENRKYQFIIMSRKLLNEELNRLTTEEYKDAEKLPIVVVLDNVRSLNNIGSVFRTSDAFRLSRYIFVVSRQHHPIRKYTKRPSGRRKRGLGVFRRNHRYEFRH